MSAGGLRLQVLDDREIERIERTALQLLANVGVSVAHRRALELLHGAGCRVDRGRVQIPPDALQSGLGRLSRRIAFRSADGATELALGDGALRVHNMGGPAYVLDLETGARRPALLKDAVDFARLLDGLAHVDVAIPIVDPQDVPPPVMRLESWAATLRHCRKPLGGFTAENPGEVRYAAAMAEACLGTARPDSPVLSVAVSPTSPLRFTDAAAGAIVAAAEVGAQLVPLSAPTLGAASPLSLAAGLALQHAEVLASLLLFALARPGLPAMYASRISSLDMRSATSTWGGSTVGLAGAAATQLAHHLGLACDVYGLSSGSPHVDAQMAYEKCANAMLPALAGADVLSGIAFLDNGVVAGYDVAVFDDELVGLLKHTAQGCLADDESLAYDLMSDVILADGNFLAEPHTVAQIRQGRTWLPGLSRRSSEGSDVGLAGRARARARQILSTHEVEPLPEDAEQQLSAILAQAYRELVDD